MKTRYLALFLFTVGFITVAKAQLEGGKLVMGHNASYAVAPHNYLNNNSFTISAKLKVCNADSGVLFSSFALADTTGFELLYFDDSILLKWGNNHHFRSGFSLQNKNHVLRLSYSILDSTVSISIDKNTILQHKAEPSSFQRFNLAKGIYGNGLKSIIETIRIDSVVNSDTLTELALGHTVALWTFDFTESDSIVPDGSGKENNLIMRNGTYISYPPLKNTTYYRCDNDSITLEGGSFFGIFSWSPAIGLSDTFSPFPMCYPSVNTNYSLLKTELNYCPSDTFFYKIEQKQRPVITVTPNDTTICAGSFTYLIAKGASLFLWSPSGLVDNPLNFQVKVTPSQSTQFVVRGTNDNICFGFDVAVVNVEVCNSIEQPLQSHIEVFPNPAQNFLHIQNAFNVMHYQIINPEGKIVLEGDSISTIDIQMLPKGIYFLRLSDKNATLNPRIILIE